MPIPDTMATRFCRPFRHRLSHIGSAGSQEFPLRFPNSWHSKVFIPPCSMENVWRITCFPME